MSKEKIKAAKAREKAKLRERKKAEDKRLLTEIKKRAKEGSLDLGKIKNPILQQLIKEVTNDDKVVKRNYYNRTHNRHNRSAA
ncbi:MAG: YhhA family cyclophane-containing RiPP [Saprospiraceae bacterium]